MEDKAAQEKERRAVMMDEDDEDIISTRDVFLLSGMATTSQRYRSSLLSSDGASFNGHDRLRTGGVAQTPYQRKGCQGAL